MEPAKVLICEDEALVALELQQRLQHFGYEVIGIASGGREAYDIASQHRPDLALMDINLNGELSGPEIAEILGKEFNIPSIYLTAYADPDTVNRASRTEPLGYLVKPVTDHELELAIRFGLAQHRAQRDLKDKMVRNNQKLERTQAILNEISFNLAREIRMRGLQDLIGGIAHYFNNSLMSISGFLEFLRDGGGLQPFQIRQVKRILEIYGEQKQFVKRLLWTSGHSSNQLALHPLHEIISEAVGKVLPKNKNSKIRLTEKLTPTKQVVLIDREAMTQAMISVLENAVEAVGESGDISISLTESFEEIPERFNSQAAPGKYSVITVQDSGAGIDPEIVNKVVEPFFSTRHERLATGLGLSEAYGILQEHGGWIELSSKQGVGTTVQLFLPHEQQAA